jgi:prepilin-type processing-associated H-X9-DG protein
MKANGANALFVGGHINESTAFAAASVAFDRLRALAEIALVVEYGVIHIRSARSPFAFAQNVRPLVNKRPAEVAMI